MRFVFRKLGELPYRLPDECEPLRGTQAPTPVVLRDHIRVWFSSRDSQGRSHALFYDLDLDQPLTVLGTAQDGAIPLGAPGEFDCDGVMPSQAINGAIDRLALYYTGWNRITGHQYRYRTACGLATREASDILEKSLLLDRLAAAPSGTSMPFYDSERSQLWYMRYLRWERGEPFYDVACRLSWTGNAGTDVTFLPLREGEGGIARPVILSYGGRTFLFACVRGCWDYREGGKEAYRPLLAEIYHRSDSSVLVKRINDGIRILGGEGDTMQAYLYPLVARNNIYLFYNNGFQSQIQVAVLEEVQDHAIL